jgi:DNA-binding NtrC family response regulator
MTMVSVYPFGFQPRPHGLRHRNHMQPPDSPPTPPTAARSPKWILVVDDEPSMRSLIEIVLVSRGYTVQTAGGAEEAIAVINAAKEPPSLVVCDVMMPKVDGLELVRRLCARIPGLAAIFVSGHLTDVAWWPKDLRDQRFLSKPFDNQLLLTAVREALAEDAASD